MTLLCGLSINKYKKQETKLYTQGVVYKQYAPFSQGDKETHNHMFYRSDDMIGSNEKHYLIDHNGEQSKKR